MVLSKLQVNWMIVGQGPIAVGAGELFGHFFSRLSFLFSSQYLSGRRADID